MFNPKLIDFVSKRVGDYQFSPQWYFLLGRRRCSRTNASRGWACGPASRR